MSWSVRGLGSRKSVRVGDAAGDQPVANATIFFGREDVIADGQVVGVAVDELEGEHSALSTQHSAARVLRTSYNTRTGVQFTLRVAS